VTNGRVPKNQKWAGKENRGLKGKILAGGKILEIGEDPGDEGDGWRQTLGDAQGS